MNWTATTDENGLPRWTGTDSIINQRRREAYYLKYGGGGLLILCFLIVTVISISTRGSNSVQSQFGGGALSLVFGLVGLGLLANLVVVAAKGGAPTQKWFDEPWVMGAVSNASFTGFEFIRGASRFRSEERWKARLDDIARIEVGFTKEWTPLREIGAYKYPTTDVEYQVFFYMNDGSRRVVMAANAAREECAALAHSIRTYLEAQRHNPVKGRARQDDLPEGFNL